MKSKLQVLLLWAGIFWVPLSLGNIPDSRSLKFFHTHTGASLDVTYFVNGAYDNGALQEVNAFLADWRDAQQQDIDPALLDILWKINQQTVQDGVYEVISAYRSPATNEMLRRNTTGVAKSSQHVVGKAIDVRLRGLDTETLRNTAKELKLGGVGYYAESDFVHIDTGRPRYW